MKSLLVLGTLLSLSPAASAATLPSSWYLLPEHRAEGRQLVAKENERELEAGLDRELGNLFSAQASALEEYSASAQSPLLANKDKVPWRFVAFMVDLGVTANGKFGTLGWKGSPALTVQWQKKEQQKKEGSSFSPLAKEEAGDATTADLSLSAETSAADLDAEIDTVVKAAIASHKVQNEVELRKNFREAAYGFAALGHKVDQAKSASVWEVARLRVDLSVEASGKVSFSPSAGAALRVRLEWFRVPGKKPAFQPALAAEGNKWFRVNGVEPFLLALSRDLAAAAEQDKTPGVDLEAKTIKVSAGASVTGAIGLAKGTASSMVHIYFNKVKKSPLLVSLPQAVDEIPLYLVEDEPAEGNLRFARDNGALVELAAKRVGDGRSALYRVDREKFRKGISKAVWWGRFFGKRANKHAGASWNVKQIKAGYEVSISGSVGVVTLAGNAGAEIVFENTKF